MKVMYRIWWVYPHDLDPTDLISILSDACPFHEETNDIMTSQKKGEAAYANFKSESADQREKAMFWLVVKDAVEKI